MPHQNYILDGEAIPSVTEILSGKPKPWLQKWRERWGILADRKVAAANKIGTAFHSAAELLALGKSVPYPNNRRLGVMLERFEEWLRESGFRPLKTELHVVSRLHRYHGTFDAIGYLAKAPKTLVLCDWKTSSGLYPDMLLQLAAYAQAYFEETGKRIRKGVIVLVQKDKPHHKRYVQEYTLGKRALGAFLKRLKEYNEARLAA